MTARLSHGLRLVLVALVLLAPGCVAGRGAPAVIPASPFSDWTATRDSALQRASAGRHGGADSVLAAFARRWPGAPQEAESVLWRIRLLLDPANPATTPSEILARIDSLSPRVPAGPHREELALLRRAAVRLQALTTEVTAARTLQADGRLKDEELVKLKEELARAQAELERVRRRVTRPRP